MVHKYKQYLYVLAFVSIAPRQGTCPHHQAYWLSVKKTPSTEKVFLITSQVLVLAPAQYKKKLLSFEQFPSLYSICVTGIVFLKTSLSLSRALLLLRIAPRCSLPQQQLLPLPFLLCAVVFNKSLKPSVSIDPSLVLCLIHCLSPTPSAILLRFTELRSSSVWRSPSSRQVLSS